MTKKQEDNSRIENLKQRIEIEFERVLGTPLPAVINSAQIQKTGTRNITSLDKDANLGVGGLQPLPGARRKGAKRLYLTQDVINFVLGIQEKW